MKRYDAIGTLRRPQMLAMITVYKTINRKGGGGGDDDLVVFSA